MGCCELSSPMAEKMCNTINQNMNSSVEPYSIKVINDYLKTFGTLFNNNVNSNTLEPNNLSVKLLMKDDSNLSSTSDYSDADIEFREVKGDTTNSIPNTTCSRSPTFCGPSCMAVTPTDDTLSDFDLEKFERELNHPASDSEAVLCNSLSDFHNVGEVILSIRHRLESFLKENQENNSVGQAAPATNKHTLEEKVSALKVELESYLKAIDERKEAELRKFSENMIKQSHFRVFENFRKEKLQTNFYETLGSNEYAIANNDSLPSIRGGFTLRNCYDTAQHCGFDSFSDNSSVEFYTMLINEEKSEVLNDANPRFNPREKISLVFRDSEEIIKQWQKYQLRTICIKSKHIPFLSHNSIQSRSGFTLSSLQNQTLQLKLRKEKRTRLIFRFSFYVLSVICFVLVVISTESIFTFEKRSAINF